MSLYAAKAHVYRVHGRHRGVPQYAGLNAALKVFGSESKIAA
jgi:hypothetical protein